MATKPTASTPQTRGAGKIPKPPKNSNEQKKAVDPTKKRQQTKKKAVELIDATCQTDIFDKADKLAHTNQESEINGLRLENCVLKNLTDDLTKKLEQEKSQVTDVSQHVTQLNKKLETVSAQLKLSQDLINLNSKLKAENDKLRLRINNANKAISRCEKLQSMMDGLETKVKQADKIVLENASLKKELQSLQMENVISKESLKNLKDILSKTSHGSVNKTDESKGAGEKRRQPKRKDNFGYENSDQTQHQQETIKKSRKGAKTSHSDQYTNHPKRVYPNRNNTEDIEMNYTAVRPQDQYYFNPTRNVHGKQPPNQPRNDSHYR